VLEPLFEFGHNDDVRKYSLKAAAKALGCCENPETAAAYLNGLFPAIRGKLGNAYINHPREAKRLIKCLVLACNAVPNVACIGLAEATESARALAACVTEVFNRKSVRDQ
jgi:hypothetical protein